MTRPSPRTLALAALLAGLAAPAAAQDRPFQFGPHPYKASDLRTDIDVRPNTKEARYLYLKNPSDEDGTYTVELRGPVGSSLSAVGKVSFNRKADEANQGYARVVFAKPAPPPAPAAPPPPVPQPPPGTPAPPKVEPPPGVELVREGTAGFQFTLRLLDDAGKPVLVQGKPLEQVVTVGVRKPTDYVSVTNVKAFTEGDAQQLIAEATAADSFGGPPCPVVLDLPRQDALDPVRLGPGAYRRVLTAANQTVQLQVRNLPLRSASPEPVRFGLDVDGYPRAFAYRADLRVLTRTDVLKTVERPYVRIYPAVAPPDVARYYVRPGAAFPVRVELDGPLQDGRRVQLLVDRNGDNRYDPADEVVSLPGLRDEKIWLEPAHEGGAVLVSTVVDDWVRDIDTRSLQGEILVTAAVVEKDGKVVSTQKEGPVASSLTLIVDNTPPERIDFARLPEKHLKGTPLPVAVRVIDPELTPVKKAAFFIGRPTEDGKPPEGAALVPATVDPKNPAVWRAELPLPPDRKGELFVSVVTETIVGFGAFATQRVLLVDAPPPAGTIVGTVALGGRLQAGLVVQLFDAEGKPKGATTSGPKGEFEFQGVPPGVYRVASEKPDSVSRMVGAAPAEVKAGETTTVVLALARPRPPAR